MRLPPGTSGRAQGDATIFAADVPQQHHRPSLVLSCLSQPRLKMKEKLEKGKVGGQNATELINSFEGDGELSQVHIKGQGNEC